MEDLPDLEKQALELFFYANDIEFAPIFGK